MRERETLQSIIYEAQEEKNQTHPIVHHLGTQNRTTKTKTATNKQTEKQKKNPNMH